MNSVENSSESPQSFIFSSFRHVEENLIEILGEILMIFFHLGNSLFRASD